MQLKQPLTLLDVALTSWHVLGVPGTYKYHLQPLRFENLKRGTQSPSVDCRATLRTAHTFFHFSANQWAYLTEIGRKTSEKDAPVWGPDPDWSMLATPIDRGGIGVHDFQCLPVHFLLYRPFCLPVSGSFLSFSYCKAGIVDSAQLKPTSGVRSAAEGRWAAKPFLVLGRWRKGLPGAYDKGRSAYSPPYCTKRGLGGRSGS